MNVTGRLRRAGVNGLSAGEIGAQADYIDEQLRGCVTVNVKGADGRHILPGDVVYGQDGRGWKVVGIGAGVYPVIVVRDGGDTCRGSFIRMRADWCTHVRPLSVLGRTVGDIAAKGTGITIGDIAELECIAADLERRGE